MRSLGIPTWLPLAWCLAACARRAPVREPVTEDIPATAQEPPHASCPQVSRHARVDPAVGCALGPREVRTWGASPREGPPTPRCPIRVRAYGERVVAEPIRSLFDPLPFEECVPQSYLAGARHVLRVDDGWFVAYEGAFASEVSWFSEDGRSSRRLLNARTVGFARGPSGDVLALAVGRAHLGRGAVIRFARSDGGAWRPRFVTILPLEPGAVAFDDAGVLVGHAGRFVFRVDEDGRLENVHYLSRDVGRVASIAHAPGGPYYLGLECGIVRLVPGPDGIFREDWWSARDGASGRWSECPG